MDSQRPFLYLALIFLGFLLWTTWQQDHAPQPVVTETAQSTGPVAADGAGTTIPNEVPSAAATTPTRSAAPVEETAGGAQLIHVRTDVLDLQISTRGGEIIAADLPTYPISLEQPDQPVRILNRDEKNYVAQSGLLNQNNDPALAPNHLAPFSAEKQAYVLQDGQDSLVVPLRWQSADGLTVVKQFEFRRGSFSVNMTQSLQNGSGKPWAGLEYLQFKHGPAESKGGMMGIRAFEGGAIYEDRKYTRINFTDMGEKLDGHNVKADGGWVSVLQHYFVSAWIPPADQNNTYYSNESADRGVPVYILGTQGPLISVAAGASHNFSSQFWVGPKLQDELEALAPGLDLTVDYGVLAFISKPIFWIMQHIHSLVGNWGWTIILLTMLIKAVFFWPSAASYKSMAKMKAVAPRMKEINERFSSDPQGKQKAMMELYKKEKINPLGGCLPILIQIPVFMGLYWVLLESVELRQAPWLLWYKDLSVMDPYYILPLIMGASMFLQQKLNPPQADPMQQKIFQFLPVIFTFMFLWFPAGLVLYWVVNNILSIAQQWVINKKIVGHA